MKKINNLKVINIVIIGGSISCSEAANMLININFQFFPLSIPVSLIEKYTS